MTFIRNNQFAKTKFKHAFIFIVILGMHILIVNNTSIPVQKYGGTERVIWWLGKQLVKMGHQVSYLVAS